jgi:DNA polymerase
MTPDRIRAARDILDFYVENGADAVLGEEPVDRFADTSPFTSPLVGEVDARSAAGGGSIERARSTQSALTQSLTHKGGGSSQVSAPPATEEAVMTARSAARKAASLEELRSILQAFEGCGLRATAKQLVFADGNPKSRLMFVGEAPGREEDLEGLPFVGPSGQLLNRMIAAIGLKRAEVYIANIIPWRPPGNRDPSTHETQICLPFIQRQVELVNPDVLVCLGKPSSIALLGVTDGIRRTRGRWMPYNTGTREIRAMPMFHPAYLLRSPLEKRLAWRDMLAVKKALAGH